MEIRLRGLSTESPQEFRLEAKEWSRVLKILKTRKLVDGQTLARLESSPSGVQINEGGGRTGDALPDPLPVDTPEARG